MSTTACVYRDAKATPSTPYGRIFPLLAALPAGSGPSGAPSAPPAPGCPSSPDNPLLHQGYSFVAPSILFDRNNAVMTDVLEASGAGDRPGPAALARSVMMQVDWARVGRSGRGDSRSVFTRRTWWLRRGPEPLRGGAWHSRKAPARTSDASLSPPGLALLPAVRTGPAGTRVGPG